MTINVDHREMLTTNIEARSLDTWDSDFRLAIGNELTNDRPWLGSVKALLVGPTSDVRDYLSASSLVFPKRLWHLPPRLRALFDGSVWMTNRLDTTLNVIGFLPLPFLLVAAAVPAGRKFTILTIAVLVSVSIELGQIFFANRQPSLADLAFNTLGAALGILWLRVVNAFRTSA
jgi:VanZ family protein